LITSPLNEDVFELCSINPLFIGGQNKTQPARIDASLKLLLHYRWLITVFLIFSSCHLILIFRLLFFGFSACSGFLVE